MSEDSSERKKWLKYICQPELLSLKSKKSDLMTILQQNTKSSVVNVVCKALHPFDWPLLPLMADGSLKDQLLTLFKC
jgi:hypothetical protein